jgi:ComEC/Rec2-related protein
MAAILIAALKLIGISKPKWGFFLIPLLFIYVVSTGMKPSAFRAFTMASVYFAAPLVHRRPDSVSAIALSAMVLLFINPLQLGDPGFLLSFTVVSGIVMVHLYVSRRLGGVVRPNWAVPLSQLSGSRPIMAAGRTVALLALTSFAAWVFSVPLTAVFFHTISPAALLANLAVIPLTFMIVLTGCLSLLSAPVYLAAAVIFNHANRVFISVLITVIRGAEALPWLSCRFVQAPPVGSMILWYGGLIIFFAGPRRRGPVGFSLVLLAGLTWFMASHPVIDGLQIAIESDAAVIIRSVKTRQQVLLVNGDSYSVSRARQRLRKEGINHLSALALCGKSLDEKAVSDLCKTFSVSNVWMLPAFKAHLPALEKTGANVFFCERPTWHVGDGAVTADLN